MGPKKKANYIFLKKISSKNDLKRIVADSSLSASVDQIFNMYKHCIKEDTSFLLIDLEAPAEKTYRKN